jgi:hypothetical protein
MRSFLVAALGFALAACAAKQAKPEAEAAQPAPPPPVPANCDEPAQAASSARNAEDSSEKTSAVFALAECEHLRWGAKKDNAAKLKDIADLYAEAIAGKVPKYVIGGHVRTGDLFREAGEQQKAKEAYENGLTAADGTDSNTRLDLDISDWVKAACKGVHSFGGEERRFKVCQPWKESWR